MVQKNDADLDFIFSSEVTHNSEKIKATNAKLRIDAHKLATLEPFGDEQCVAMSEPIKRRLARSESLPRLQSLLELGNLSPEVESIFEERVLQEADVICLDTRFDYYYSAYLPFAQFLTERSELLARLSDENIGLLLNEHTAKNENFVAELRRRVEAGRIHLDFPMGTHNWSQVQNDLEMAYEELPENIVDQIFKQQHELIDKNFPPEWEDLKINSHGRAQIARMRAEGRWGSEADAAMKILRERGTLSRVDFDYRLLEAPILQALGEQTVLDLGPYPELAAKLRSLYDAQNGVFDLYARVVQQLKADTSLGAFNAKNEALLNFVFRNQAFLATQADKIKPQTLADYVLFYETKTDLQYKELHDDEEDRERVWVDLSENFLEDFYDACQSKLRLKERQYRQDLSALSDKQERAERREELSEEYRRVLCLELFGVTLSETRQFVKTFGEHLGEIPGELLQSENGQKVSAVLDLMRKVSVDYNLTNLRALAKSADFRLTPSEMLRTTEMARQLYAETYVLKLAKTQEQIDATAAELVPIGDKTVRVITLHSDFGLIVHSNDSGFFGDDEKSFQAGYKTGWQQMDPYFHHGLSTSFISSENMATARIRGQGVLYGFTQMKPADLWTMGAQDVYSETRRYVFETCEQPMFIPESSLNKYTTNIYNELVLSRADAEPTCVVIFDDMSQELQNNAFKAAAEWEIPVVRIDKREVATRKKAQMDTWLGEFRQQGDWQALEQAIDLFESVTSGLKLNLYDPEEEQFVANKDVADDSDLRQMLDAGAWRQFLDEVIQKAKDASDDKALTRLQTILERVQARYIIWDENTANAPDVKMKSLLDLDKHTQQAERESAAVRQARQARRREQQVLGKVA